MYNIGTHNSEQQTNSLWPSFVVFFVGVLLASVCAKLCVCVYVFGVGVFRVRRNWVVLDDSLLRYFRLCVYVLFISTRIPQT